MLFLLLTPQALDFTAAGQLQRRLADIVTHFVQCPPCQIFSNLLDCFLAQTVIMRNGSTNSIADWHRHCQLTQQAPFHLFLLQVFASSSWDHAIRFKNLYIKRFFGIVYCSLSFSDRIPEYPARSSLHEDVQSCWKVQETYFTYTFKMEHSIMSNLYLVNLVRHSLSLRCSVPISCTLWPSIIRQSSVLLAYLLL